MKEIALHILDIVQNSISAEASLIGIDVNISDADDRLTLAITDNGKGMDKEQVSKATSPFATTRTTRKVGMGLPLFKAGAEATGGTFTITSTLGQGTCVNVSYVLDHIDRPPLGDIGSTVHMLIVSNPTLDFIFKFTYNQIHEELNTKEVRTVLGNEIPLNTPEVSLWLKESLEGIFKPKYANI